MQAGGAHARARVCKMASSDPSPSRAGGSPPSAVGRLVGRLPKARRISHTTIWSGFNSAEMLLNKFEEDTRAVNYMVDSVRRAIHVVPACPLKDKMLGNMEARFEALTMAVEAPTIGLLADLNASPDCKAVLASDNLTSAVPLHNVRAMAMELLSKTSFWEFTTSKATFHLRLEQLRIILDITQLSAQLLKKLISRHVANASGGGDDGDDDGDDGDDGAPGHDGSHIRVASCSSGAAASGDAGTSAEATTMAGGAH